MSPDRFLLSKWSGDGSTPPLGPALLQRFGGELSCTFQGQPWGSTHDVVKARLLASGYTGGTADPSGDLTFDGPVAGQPGEVLTLFGPHDRLLKVTLLVQPPCGSLVRTFRTLCSDVAKRFGPPSNDFEVYKPPYRRDDSHTEWRVRPRWRATERA